MSGLTNSEDQSASSPRAGSDATASSPLPGNNPSSSPLATVGPSRAVSNPCGPTNTSNSNRIGRQLSKSDPLMQLLHAYQQNNLQLFQHLLRDVDPYGFTTADPNHVYGPPLNATCLEMACKKTDRSSFVRVLLQSGSDPNQINPFNNKRAPIHLVAEKSCVDSMRFLLDHNSIDINLQDASQDTALHLLAKQKTDAALECVKLLLDNADINVNQKDSVGHTALDIAINHGSKEIVQTMLDICGKRLNLDTPHRLDRQTTRTVLMDTFKDIKKIPEMKQGKTSVMELKQILFSHLHKQECDTFIAELERDEVNIFEVINKNDGWNTYLQYATKYNLYNVVRRLLELKADPNVVTTTDRRPPLVIACIQREYATVDLLLQLGVAVNIDAADGRGNTALHWAVRNRDLRMIVKLVNRGADHRIRNNFDEPPLSADAMSDILGRCLRCNDSYPDTDDYELLFDYSVLVATEELPSNSTSDEERCFDADMTPTPAPEMEFLHRMSRSQEYADLLKTPIVSSFLHMKWQRFKYLFYTNVIVDLVFILFLGCHLKSEGVALLHNICMITIIVFYLIKEILKVCSSSCMEYAKEYENVLNLLLMFVACFSVGRDAIPYNLSPVLAPFVFPVAFKLVLILGRLPQVSKYNEMLQRVFLESCALIFYFSGIILAFTFCFSAFFGGVGYYSGAGRSMFEIPPNAWYRTMLTMTEGFSTEDFSTRLLSHLWGCFAIVFGFTVSIALANTLIGLAVHHTLAVQRKADELAIKSKIKHVYKIERLLIYCHHLLDNPCFTKKSFNTSYGILTPISYWLEKRIIFLNVSSWNKIIKIAPNKHNLVIFPENMIYDGNFKIYNRVVGEAMKIISHRNQSKIQALIN